MNPELRQTLQSISRNLESANEAAQENIYSFTQRYIDPCLSSARSCLQECAEPCFGARGEQLRRKRGRSRGRPELNFDFYDDWDEDADATTGLIGWGDDELDSLLAQGTRGDRRAGEPRKQAGMTYGAGGRTKRSPAHDPTEEDPTVIPSSSYLGFLERLPFKFGGKLRYKPSAADLQENPGGLKEGGVGETLVDEEREDDDPDVPAKGRLRSGTNASRSTINSLSSRGDLIPSDEEADAIPLDDEFAVALERRTTTTTNTSEDRSSGKSRPGKKSRVSGASMRTLSSLSTKNSQNGGRVSSTNSMKDVSQTQLSPTTFSPNPPSSTKADQDKGEPDRVRRGGVASTPMSDRGLSSDDEVSESNVLQDRAELSRIKG